MHNNNFYSKSINNEDFPFLHEQAFSRFNDYGLEPG